MPVQIPVSRANANVLQMLCTASRKSRGGKNGTRRIRSAFSGSTSASAAT